jgi:hypothetical protein
MSTAKRADGGKSHQSLIALGGKTDGLVDTAAACFVLTDQRVRQHRETSFFPTSVANLSKAVCLNTLLGSFVEHPPPYCGNWDILVTDLGINFSFYLLRLGGKGGWTSQTWPWLWGGHPVK